MFHKSHSSRTSFPGRASIVPSSASKFLASQNPKNSLDKENVHVFSTPFSGKAPRRVKPTPSRTASVMKRREKRAPLNGIPVKNHSIASHLNSISHAIQKDMKEAKEILEREESETKPLFNVPQKLEPLEEKLPSPVTSEDEDVTALIHTYLHTKLTDDDSFLEEMKDLDEKLKALDTGKIVEVVKEESQSRIMHQPQQKHTEHAPPSTQTVSNTFKVPKLSTKKSQQKRTYTADNAPAPQQCASMSFNTSTDQDTRTHMLLTAATPGLTGNPLQHDDFPPATPSISNPQRKKRKQMDTSICEQSPIVSDAKRRRPAGTTPMMESPRIDLHSPRRCRTPRLFQSPSRCHSAPHNHQSLEVSLFSDLSFDDSFFRAEEGAADESLDNEAHVNILMKSLSTFAAKRKSTTATFSSTKELSAKKERGNRSSISVYDDEETEKAKEKQGGSDQHEDRMKYDTIMEMPQRNAQDAIASLRNCVGQLHDGLSLREVRERVRHECGFLFLEDSA